MTTENAHIYQLSLQTPRGMLTASFNALGARQVALALDGENALQPYDTSARPPFGTGIVMFPWVNRLRDGHFSHLGKTYRSAITEARTNNALHGLLRDRVYEVTNQTDSSITFSAELEALDSYPSPMTFSVTYQLVDAGFTATYSAKNHGQEPAPFSTGAHPYFVIGQTPTPDLMIQIPAASYLRLDARQLPVAKESVVDSQLDAREPVRVGDFMTDTDFTDLERDDLGIARVCLSEPGFGQVSGKRTTEIWLDAAFKHVHVYSTPLYPIAEGETIHAVAIEPVTAGPDALNTRDDLVTLSPDQTWSASWGVRLLDW